MNVAESEAWLQGFSLGAYRPMLRLGAGCDGAFLLARGGPETLRAYRRRQRSILREYLRALSRDFHRLLSIAAAQDRQPMAFYECQMSFIFGLLWIEARLALQTVAPHPIDLAPLLENVETLVASARELARPALRSFVMKA